MTPAELEARLIAYGVAFLLLVGGAGWAGYTIAAHHYERLELIEKDAQNTALQEAQRNVIAAQAAQKSAEDRANVETIARQKADTDSRNAVLGSVRGLEAALHLGKLSAAVDHSGAVPNGTAVAGSDLATSSKR
jgi:hypothetical protein